MLADQTEESQDSKILEGFDINDLNEDSIKSFRNRLSAVKLDHPWISLDSKAFLYKLDAYGKDRKTGEEGITVAGLLMFGEERAIVDEFPKYFLDYREKYLEDIRREYRAISSEGTWSGLENIQLAWKEQKWIAPDLEEEYNPDRINLILRTVSMLPMESVELLRDALGQQYEQLSKDEVMALVTAHQESYVTNYRLQQLIDTHAINSNKILSLLVEKGYLQSDGIGMGTRYYLTKNFKMIDEYGASKSDDKVIKASEHSKESDSILLSNDEIKAINFIKKNGYINNSLSRETLGYTKHQSVILFNSLIEKGLIEKKGKSSSTTYQLKKI